MKGVYKEYIGSLAGTFLFVVAMNLIIEPLNLYNGNIAGCAQVINDIMVEFLPLGLPVGTNLVGIIMYIINLPLFVLAYKELSKRIFVRTILVVSFQSLALQLVPIPVAPILKDPLTACIIAGIISGYGVGTTLKCGSTGGGTDILGLFCAKKYPNFSVGKVQIMLSSFVFLYGALRYNLETVAYSAIFLVVSSITIDKVHEQNIKISALIFTKNPKVSEKIIQELDRGATQWMGEGCYLHAKTYIFMTVISKYEVSQLKQLVHELDSQAFITFNHSVSVDGNFVKRL